MKKKALVISIFIIIVLAIAVGVLFWGLQPVQQEQVTLEKLNKQLSTAYAIPTKLPFVGETECYIDYIKGHEGVVLNKFQLSIDKAQGYTIKLSDGARLINLSSGGIRIDIAQDENCISATYNEVSINYIVIQNDNDTSLILQFSLSNKIYEITATYNKSIAKEIFVADITFIVAELI